MEPELSRAPGKDHAMIYIVAALMMTFLSGPCILLTFQGKTQSIVAGVATISFITFGLMSFCIAWTCIGYGETKPLKGLVNCASCTLCLGMFVSVSLLYVLVVVCTLNAWDVSL